VEFAWCGTQTVPEFILGICKHFSIMEDMNVNLIAQILSDF
jgi:hypothetical protein